MMQGKSGQWSFHDAAASRKHIGITRQKEHKRAHTHTQRRARAGRAIVAVEHLRSLLNLCNLNTLFAINCPTHFFFQVRVRSDSSRGHPASPQSRMHSAVCTVAGTL